MSGRWGIIMGSIVGRLEGCEVMNSCAGCRIRSVASSEEQFPGTRSQ